MTKSYLKNCFIKTKPGDFQAITGQVKNDCVELKTLKLDGYAIIPLSEYQSLVPNLEIADSTLMEFARDCFE